MEEKKKTNIAFIILTIIIIILIGYIFYDKGILFAHGDNATGENNITEENNGNEGNKEVEISDALLVADLSAKVTYLNSTAIYVDFEPFKNESDKSNNIPNLNFNKDLYTKELTSDDKLYIALNSLEKNFENLTIQYENMNSDVQEFFKPYVEVGSINNIVEKQISASKVEERYLSLFGEKLEYHKNIKNCPIYTYDSKNNIYYYSRPCGGTSTGYTYLYKNKFTMQNDYAYVYVNIGQSNLDDNKVYDNFEGSDNNKIIENYTESFSINESNYSKYSEYKYTFKKNNDGSYYFVKVEKN